MIYYKLTNRATGEECGGLASCWADYAGRVDVGCVDYAAELKIHGRTYAERKASAEELAVEYSNNTAPGLSWGEMAEIEEFFERIGRRYGLLTEFRENAIC